MPAIILGKHSMCIVINTQLYFCLYCLFRLYSRAGIFPWPWVILEGGTGNGGHKNGTFPNILRKSKVLWLFSETINSLASVLEMSHPREYLNGLILNLLPPQLMIVSGWKAGVGKRDGPTLLCTSRLLCSVCPTDSKGIGQVGETRKGKGRGLASGWHHTLGSS